METNDFSSSEIILHLPAVGCVGPLLTLRHPCHYVTREIRQALQILAEAISALIQPAQSVVGICRDPHDDYILSCSIEASVAYLVTGDSDLLELQQFRGTRIVTPRDFEMLFEE